MSYRKQEDEGFAAIGRINEQVEEDEEKPNDADSASQREGAPNAQWTQLGILTQHNLN